MGGAANSKHRQRTPRHKTHAHGRNHHNKKTDCRPSADVQPESAHCFDRSIASEHMASGPRDRACSRWGPERPTSGCGYVGRESDALDGRFPYCVRNQKPDRGLFRMRNRYVWENSAVDDKSCSPIAVPLMCCSDKSAVVYGGSVCSRNEYCLYVEMFV